MSKRVLVFSSNEAGIHTAGVAKIAYEKHGARYGKSFGHYGDSFAIPTRDQTFVALPLDLIEDYVRGFLAYARGHHKLEFQVMKLDGGFTDAIMASLFKGAPNNVLFDRAYYPYLGETVTYWGRES